MCVGGDGIGREERDRVGVEREGRVGKKRRGCGGEWEMGETWKEGRGSSRPLRTGRWTLALVAAGEERLAG